MTFGEAIKAVKDGKKARRSGWNGKTQYIEIGTHISYKTPAGEIKNADHETAGNSAIVFYGTIGSQVGWLASQADMLSDDWEVFE